MADNPIDAYLAGVEEPKRATLQHLRTTIREVLPDAEEIIAYGAPAFAVGGKTVAGFAAAASHLSYLPHSGSVLASLAEDVTGYRTSKGALKFTVDTPLSKPLVEKLIAARLAEPGISP